VALSPNVTVDHGEPHRPRVVTVTVNYQRVELPERVMTGLEIKQAAIAQGVEIGPNFQLSVKRGDHYDVVGDTDPVHVHEQEDFLAVAPDDNS
jgi:Multiubiquitin